MKEKVTIYILLLVAASFKSFASPLDLPVDSVMKRVMLAAENYNDLAENFSAEVYTRTYVETVKKNFLYKYTHMIPRFVLHDPNNDEALIETISDLRFNYPNSYIQDIKHVTGTLTGKKDIDMIPFDLLNINVYGETTNNESFFMPLRLKTAKYYRYSLSRSFIEDGKTYYSIDYSPIYHNSKLLKGSFTIEKDSWRVIFFRGEGIDIFHDFSFEITMGDDWITHFFPVQFTIYEKVSYLGNILSFRHLADIKYKDVELRRISEQKKPLNISNLYKVRLDSVPVQVDSAFWSKRRPIPLQAMEIDVIEKYNKRRIKDASRKARRDSLGEFNIVQQVAQHVVMDSKYKYRSTAIGYSGLLNPFLIGYSSNDGVTYRQKANFNFDIRRGRTVNIDAFVGYMFRHKELLSDITTKWNYKPSRLGSMTLSLGNGYPTYSSQFVKQIQDSLNNQGFDFKDVSVKYYKDYYVKFFNTFELANGLLFDTGIDYHIRKSKNNMSKLRSAENDEMPPSPTDSKPIEGMFGTQKSFAPFIRVTWTPRQYYRYDGVQKIYEYSPFPTFKFEFSRSIQGVFGSTSEFNRVEADMSQIIPFGLCHSLHYHVGAGMFIDQKTEYFADFRYFSKRNFPENWDDGLGGVFNLLNRNFYNASDSYIQAHLMLEAPFLILKTIPFASKFAENERIYLSHLHTPQIKSYAEIGYGIGNRFFNAGIFFAFLKDEFRKVGIRTSFEF